MALLDDCVKQSEDETWTFQCVGFRESRCGDLATGQPFVSSGWPTKKAALARGGQHFDEHRLSLHITEAVNAAVAEADDPESVDRAAIAAKVADETGYQPMQELHQFRVDQGLVVNDDGSVSVADIMPAKKG